jgi:hypothetical protein
MISKQVLIPQKKATLSTAKGNVDWVTDTEINKVK